MLTPRAASSASNYAKFKRSSLDAWDGKRNLGTSIIVGVFEVTLMAPQQWPAGPLHCHAVAFRYDSQ